MRESCVANGCHGVGNSDGGEASARESSVADCRDKLRNGDRGQAVTILEYITSCISTDFVLNGRKVIM